MQVHTGDGCLVRREALAAERCDHTGQNITSSARSQRRGRDRVHADSAIRGRHHGAGTLEDDNLIPGPGETQGDPTPIRLDRGHVQPTQTTELRRMGRQDDLIG